MGPASLGVHHHEHILGGSLRLQRMVNLGVQVLERVTPGIREKEKVSKGKGKSKGKPTPSGAPKPKKEKTQDQLARNVPRLSCCFLIMWRLFVTSCHYNVKRLFFGNSTLLAGLGRCI